MTTDITHLIAYPGKSKVSLAVMQEAYIPLYAPWPNLRIGIEGTLQRPPYTIENGLAWVRALDGKRGTDEVFAILLQENAENAEKPNLRYVGHTGLHKISWPDGTAVSGSTIGDPVGRGNGAGTEAKLLLLYHAFMVLGVRKVSSKVKAFNAPSLGHLIKCGYRIIGREKQQRFHEGRFVDEILLEVFREDWESLWQQYAGSGLLPKLSDEQKALVQKETST